jgi:hypothetical protein
MNWLERADANSAEVSVSQLPKVPKEIQRQQWQYSILPVGSIESFHRQ